MNNLELIQQVMEGKPLYALFNRPEVDCMLQGVTLEKTPWRGELSNKSLRIKCSDSNECTDLIKIFGLNEGVFPAKYKKAIGGDGKEAQKIRTLHSSSLIGLLCFYDVSDTKPLRLTIDGRNFSFTASSFEEKNLVGLDETGNPHYSNMDVVLYGKDLISGKPVVLFLESKFSEYLTWGQYSKISNHVYKETYSKLISNGCLGRMGLKFEDNPDEAGYSVLSSDKGKTRHYAGGIKQMVSHFIGIEKISEEYRNKGYDVYLGEILFLFSSIDDGPEKFNDYSRLYDLLAVGLNDLSESKFKVLDHCLTYQDVFSGFELDRDVRQFYAL